jgi:transposase-like protein
MELLAAGRYRRVESRRGCRNGFYERDLATQIGIVTAIRVPRVRQGKAEYKVFGRYHRRQAQVDRLLRDMFLAGVSTRRVGEALEAILGERVSAQTVSRVVRSPEWEVERFHMLLRGLSGRCEGAQQVYTQVVHYRAPDTALSIASA